jgi:hypothetical protein
VVPQVLVPYPPLAELTNELHISLNGLRLLAPRALLPNLLGVLDACLADAAAAFLEYAEARTTLAPEELRVLRAAGSVFAHPLVPFARRALVEGVYGIVVGKENGPKLTKASGESAKRLREGVAKWESWLDEGESDESGEGEEDEEKAATE